VVPQERHLAGRALAETAQPFLGTAGNSNEQAGAAALNGALFRFLMPTRMAIPLLSRVLALALSPAVTPESAVPWGS